MPNWLFILLVSILAVGFFVVGLSLTQLIKGHPIESEISTNKEMQRRGIKCAVQETRKADGTASCSERSARGGSKGGSRRSSEESSPLTGCSGNCGACDIERGRR